MDRDALLRRLGKSIRARRVAMGHSQDSFADRIEMHRAYFSAIERGEKNLEVGTLLRVAKGLKVAVSQLMLEAEQA